MCMLSCALIVCTLVSTARTTNTNTDDPNRPTRILFDLGETTTEDQLFTIWTPWSTQNPIPNGKYGSEPTLNHVPPVPVFLYSDEFMTADYIILHWDSIEAKRPEHIFDDWNILPSTTPTANLKYGSKPTLSTSPVTDLNDSQLYPNKFVTDNAIDISTKPENDNIPSDKKNSYTTEPIPMTNGTQLLAEPPTKYTIDP